MFSVFCFKRVIALFVIFLQLLSTGHAQGGAISGRCKCTELTILTQDEIVKRFRSISRRDPCPPTIIMFTIRRSEVLCGTISDAWVKQITNCMRGDPTPCLKRTTTPIPVTTTSPSTSEPLHIAVTSISTSTSLSTTEPLRMDGTVTSTSPSTTEPPTATKSTTDTTSENVAGEHLHNLQNSPPTTAAEKTKQLSIAVMSLLAVVFVLVGVVTFLICRRRRVKKQPYEAVEETSLENICGVAEALK